MLEAVAIAVRVSQAKARIKKTLKRDEVAGTSSGLTLRDRAMGRSKGAGVGEGRRAEATKCDSTRQGTGAGQVEENRQRFKERLGAGLL